MSSNSVDSSRAPGRQDPNARQYAFLFCDLVDSTGLKGRLNAWRYVRHVLEPHDRMFRQLLVEYPHAHEIKHLGDGFLAIFGDVRDAVCFALRFHAALRDFPWELEQPDESVRTRIGIDIGFAVTKTVDGVPVDVFGPNVDVASRVMSAADGGRTLLTATAYEIARQALPFVELNLQQAGIAPANVQFARHGEYRIQGVEQALVLCEVCLDGTPPEPPKSNPPKVINVVDERWSPEAPGGAMNPGEIPDRPGWHLVRKLGEGSFGFAYLAEDANDPGNRRVFKFCRQPDRLHTFHNELELQRHIKKLRRNDIVEYYGAHIDRPPYFLEYEFIDGGNMYDWAAAHGGLERISFDVRMDVFARIAAAVAAAHRERVFHLDLKPTNILFERLDDGTWQPKLTDFGMGVHAAEGDPHASPPQVVTPGGSGGTTMQHPYLAPETLLPLETDDGVPRAAQFDVRDVYSLGVLLFQLSVGDLQQPPVPAAMRHVPSRLLRDDIEQATHFDPEQRLSSAAELESRVRRLRIRQRRDVIGNLFVPALVMAFTILVFVGTLCVSFYNLYTAADMAKLEAQKYREQKIAAFKKLWSSLRDPGLTSDDPTADSQAAQAQLLQDLRGWLVNEANKDLLEIRDRDASPQNQLIYGRLALRISELLDDDNSTAEQQRLQDGLRVVKAALHQRPGEPAIRELISDLHNQLGQNAFISRDFAAAEQDFTECRKWRQTLVDDLAAGQIATPRPEWLYTSKLLSARHNLGELRLARMMQSQGTESSALLAELQRIQDELQPVLDGRRQLAREFPEAPELQRDLAAGEFLMGTIRQKQADLLPKTHSPGPDDPYAAAIEHYAQACAAFQLSLGFEEHAVTRQWYLSALRALVELQIDRGLLADAQRQTVQLAHEAVRILPRNLRDLDPRVYATNGRYFSNRWMADEPSSDPRDHEQALAHLLMSAQLFEIVLKIDPAQPAVWRDLGSVRYHLADLRTRRSDPAAQARATQDWQAALQAWDELRKQSPAVFEDIADLYESARAAAEEARSTLPPLQGS